MKWLGGIVGLIVLTLSQQAMALQCEMLPAKAAFEKYDIIFKGSEERFMHWSNAKDGEPSLMLASMRVQKVWKGLDAKPSDVIDVTVEYSRIADESELKKWHTLGEPHEQIIFATRIPTGDELATGIWVGPCGSWSPEEFEEALDALEGTEK